MEIRGTGETTWGVCGWDCKYITYLPAFLLRNSVVYRYIYLIIHLVDIYNFYPGPVFRPRSSFHTQTEKKKVKENLTFSLFSLPVHRHTLNPSSSGFTTTTPFHPPRPSNSAASTPTTSTNSASEIPTNGLPGTTSPSQTDIISSELSNPCREEENLARSCWRG